MAEENKKDIAIEVLDVDKSFEIPNERLDNIKELFTNPLKIFRRKTHQFEALQDISFTLKRGEFLGIVGRNGSGKSTLLKLIAGIYSPDKGKINVYGHMVPFLELGVGFNPELSGRENIYLNGTILGMTRKFIKKRYQDIVDFAELGEFIEMPMKNYSSGMLVRLAFAIAIQSDADIYILDEILAVGDAGFQMKSGQIIKDFKKFGKTVILVSHAMDSITELCDRAILIENHRIMADGDPREVIQKYQSLFGAVPQH